MKREIRGLTAFSFIWETMIFGGFIGANEFAIKNLVQVYEWFFYFMTALSVLPLLVGFPAPKYQYTKAKFHWEMITNTLLGIMLANYGYFWCATIMTFVGYVFAQQNYFSKEKENGDERTDNK